MKKTADNRLLAIFFVMTALAIAPTRSIGQPPRGANPNLPDGLSVHQPAALSSYSLVFPMNSTSTYLIDLEGCIVHEWKSDFTPALSAYLLPNGHLLRPAADRGMRGGMAGAGGRIQEFTWDGELVWDFSLSSERMTPHHDICPLPNGNVLVIAADAKTQEEAIAMGRRPESVRGQLLPDCILEIKPTGKTTGEIVWQWHAWDHLIQDVDESKPNYGDVSEHPELIDVNFGSNRFARMAADPEQLAELRSLGYVGGGGPETPDDQPDADRSETGAAEREQPSDDSAPGPNGRRDGRRRGRGGPGGPMGGDWMHTNSVAYNAELDQIMLSIHSFNEVWIIDHGTTTEEAASHSGGKRGRGGDLLYRWANPQAYRSGSNVDQRLFGQHCAHWIEEGLPGAGNMLVFNNGADRPDGSYSSVDEVVLPLQPDGTYAREEFMAYGPEQATWSYAAPEPSEFFSPLISGTQRLANGNTYICSGNSGILFEVTPAGEIVWQYTCPGGDFGPGRGGVPRPGELFPGFLTQMLGFNEQQLEQLGKLQSHVDAALLELLTDEQRGQLAEPRQFGPASDDAAPRPRRGARRGFSPPRPGEVMPTILAEELGLSEAQQADLEKLQRHVDGELKQLLTEEQTRQLDAMRQAFVGGPGFGPPRGFPGPFGPARPRDGAGDSQADNRPPDGTFRPGRPDGPPGPGRGPGGLFRSYRYALDYSAFADRDLVPGAALVDVIRQQGRTEPPRP